MATQKTTVTQKKINNTAQVKMNDIISEENASVNIDITNTTQGIKIDDSVLVKVKSNVFGQLIYVNARNGDETVWDRAGDIQTMTMGDLRAMKASQSSFFKNQWVIILGVDESSDCEATPADLYRALAITQYYKLLIDPTDFGAVCSWSVNQINDNVRQMSSGARDNLIVALNEYISRGILESIIKIRAFEKVLECSLTIPQ